MNGSETEMGKQQTSQSHPRIHSPFLDLCPLVHPSSRSRSYPPSVTSGSFLCMYVNEYNDAEYLADVGDMGDMGGDSMPALNSPFRPS